jgi:hypothetical protein
MTHRVLLVREWDAQHTGSGCCGKLGGVGTELCDPSDFSRTRAEMVRVGAVYRALHEAFAEDDVELTVVDPRNTVWMIPTVYRDARRRGLARTAALRQVARASANGAVVVDGRVVLDGKIPPTPAEAVAAVRVEIAARPGRS